MRIIHCGLLLGIWLALGSPAMLTAQDKSANPSFGPDRATMRKLDEVMDIARRVRELRARGKFDEAIPLARQAVILWREIGGAEATGTAGSLMTLGELLLEKPDFSGAESCFEEALTILRKRPDVGEGLAMCLRSLGALHRMQGNLAKARPYYEEALRIAEKEHGVGNKNTVGQLMGLGALLKSQGELAEARSYFERGLEICLKSYDADYPGTAVCRNNLGLVLLDQRELPLARTYFEEALRISRKKLGDHSITINSLNCLGNLHHARGDSATAKKHYEEALAMSLRLFGPDNLDTAAALNGLAEALSDLGDFDAALKQHLESLRIHRKLQGPDHFETGREEGNLGTFLTRIGRDADAESHHVEALRIKRAALRPGHPEIAISLNNLGLTRQKLGQSADAERHFREALEIFRAAHGDAHPDTAATLAKLSVLAAVRKNWDAAIDFEDQARRGDHQFVAHVLPGLPAREQLTFLMSRDVVGRFHLALSLALHRPQDPRVAARTAEWLINGKGISSITLADQAQLAHGSEDPRTGQLVKEQRAIRRQSTQLSLAPVPAEGAQRRRDALLELTEKDEQLFRKLIEAGGRTPQMPPWVELESLQRRLPPDGALIEIFRLRPFDFSQAMQVSAWDPYRYVAWVIRGGEQRTTRVVDLGPADAIDAAIAAVGKSMRMPADQSILRREGEKKLESLAVADLQQVANLVWNPLRKDLGDARRLWISPDASLWMLPWAALPVGEGRMLIESHSLSLLVSGRDLSNPSPARRPTTAPLLVGDPDFDLAPERARAILKSLLPARESAGAEQGAQRSSLPRVVRLPWTASEVRSVVPLVQRQYQSEPLIYSGDRALESLIKQVRSPRVALLSTHGFFLPDQETALDASPSTAAGRTSLFGDGQEAAAANPLLRCGLLFAGCNQLQSPAVDDGILTGLEISSLDLRGTELVVLSACETGVGQIRNGEGVAGLRQAFQLAGAESVIATLWQVADDESARLVGELFRKLADGRSRADALREAQLERIAARRKKVGAAHPYFWAAFTLTGS